MLVGHFLSLFEESHTNNILFLLSYSFLDCTKDQIIFLKNLM